MSFLKTVIDLNLRRSNIILRTSTAQTESSALDSDRRDQDIIRKP